MIPLRSVEWELRDGCWILWYRPEGCYSDIIMMEKA
jgi:hypothetical protein